jgi:hypothetical protein
VLGDWEPPPVDGVLDVEPEALPLELPPPPCAIAAEDRSNDTKPATIAIFMMRLHFAPLT